MTSGRPIEPSGSSGHVHPEFGPVATRELAEALNGLLADYFALFVKTKGFCWHVPGPNFHEHHTMLDLHAADTFKAIGLLGDRVRKLGAASVLSLEDIARTHRIAKLTKNHLTAQQMFDILRDDNQQLLCYLREAHGLCEEYGDVATGALLCAWIDEAESRTWHLHESARPEDSVVAGKSPQSKQGN